LIRPLILAKNSYPNNLIQGPLAGISCAPFRALTWRYGKPAFCCTEMISCKTLLHQPAHYQKRFIQKDKDEGPVSFQLSSNDPKELGEATKMVTDYGANLIDLNCGCPVTKIRKKGSGSALLLNPSRLAQLITAMKQNTHLPVSIKIRVDGNSTDTGNQEVARVIEEAGADFLIVHGRHWTETYDTPCNYDQIQFFAETLKIPVIGNGDIRCVDSLKKMLATGCAGVMIGRAGVGQPWLAAQLIAEFNNETFIGPKPDIIGNIFIEHIERLATLLNNERFACIQARKFAKYYARHLENKTDFCTQMNECENLDTLKKLCQVYFQDFKEV
jgi:tRNA-dihydrouridine synthase B